MDAQLVQAFRERWQAVEAIETQEQRNASVQLRWQQLESLWRMAKGLGLLRPEAEPDQETMTVYRRWAKLKGG